MNKIYLPLLFLVGVINNERRLIKTNSIGIDYCIYRMLFNGGLSSR